MVEASTPGAPAAIRALGAANPSPLMAHRPHQDRRG
jgi:hypothetical protein